MGADCGEEKEVGLGRDAVAGCRHRAREGCEIEDQYRAEHYCEIFALEDYSFGAKVHTLSMIYFATQDQALKIPACPHIPTPAWNSFASRVIRALSV